MGNPLDRTQFLLNTSEFILGRGLINVRIVAKTLAGTQVLLTIREFILEKNLINVKNVEKPSGTSQLLLNTSEFILERNLRNVKNVESLHQALMSYSTLENSSWRSGKGFNQSSHVIRHHRARPGEKP